MKKLTVLLAVMSTLLVSSPIHAQAGGNAARGAGANAGRTTASDSFAWGACIGTLAVVGTVIGLAASAGSNSASSFSH